MAPRITRPAVQPRSDRYSEPASSAGNGVLDPISMLLGQLAKGQETLEAAVGEIRDDVKGIGRDVASLASTVASLTGSVVVAKEGFTNRLDDVEQEAEKQRLANAESFAAVELRLDNFTAKENYWAGFAGGINWLYVKIGAAICVLVGLAGWLVTYQPWKFIN